MQWPVRRSPLRVMQIVWVKPVGFQELFVPLAQLATRVLHVSTGQRHDHVENAVFAQVGLFESLDFRGNITFLAARFGTFWRTWRWRLRG